MIDIYLLTKNLNSTEINELTDFSKNDSTKCCFYKPDNTGINQFAMFDKNIAYRLIHYMVDPNTKKVKYMLGLKDKVSLSQNNSNQIQVVQRIISGSTRYNQ